MVGACPLLKPNKMNPFSNKMSYVLKKKYVRVRMYMKL